MTAPTPPAADAHLLGLLGGSTGGATIGIEGLVRWHFVGVGAVLQHAALFGSVSQAAGAAGVALRPRRWLSVVALGVAGVDAYRGVGRGLLSSDPGVSGSLPFAGAHAGASVLFAPSAARHFELGVRLFYEADLATRTIEQTYTERGWLFGGEWTEHTAHTIGGTRLGALLGLGLTFDL